VLAVAGDVARWVRDPWWGALARREDYASMQWDPIPRYEGVRPNSIFHPNYDIIVDR
jgi:hypothetical protein